MTILAAVDGDRDEDPVVKTGYDLAQAYDDQLVVLHVMANDEFLDKQDSTPDYYLENAEETARNVGRRVTRGSLGGTGGITFQGEVGPVAETIIDVAWDLDVRYLVVGGRQRSPVGKALFGSIAQTILTDAGRPVVSVVGDDQE